MGLSADVLAVYVKFISSHLQHVTRCQCQIQSQGGASERLIAARYGRQHRDQQSVESRWNKLSAPRLGSRCFGERGDRSLFPALPCGENHVMLAMSGCKNSNLITYKSDLPAVWTLWYIILFSHGRSYKDCVFIIYFKQEKRPKVINIIWLSNRSLSC